MSKTDRFKALLYFLQGCSLVAVGLCTSTTMEVPAFMHSACPFILIFNGGLTALQAKMSLGVGQPALPQGTS